MPDLFGGRTFGSIEAGASYASEIGFDEITERGVRAVDQLSQELVYIGFSLGVLPAQKLAQTRPGAIGACFIHACLPVTEYGGAWPATVPVRIHAMEADPFFVEDGDSDAARDLVEQASDAELVWYPGDQHLFVDSSLGSYRQAEAELLHERLLTFLRPQ